ncbi:ComEC family competence protein [Ginsengibacter hankyongi]|uniref:ComEC family competence protein n=1 Tax=Ginsengibacter hankyongi TaxID=2607284 RepID=A0A5J5IQH5_9BACT|nr:ComEC/Rec2 family competence protein [Ginsengibacter hankyongi]KAA9041842.1 ComEC family competence protein [Ginsengibacter hankyongi]
MAKSYKIFIWKKAPFLRLLLPVITGILTGYYFKVEIYILLIIAIILSLAFLTFNLLPLVYRFRLQPVNGVIITGFLINAGLFLTWNKDVRNHSDWYGKTYDTSSYIIGTISEPPVEKSKSYKSLANVEAIIKKDSVYPVTGKLLLYFSKDSSAKKLVYGSRVIIKKDLQEIKNSGNPAAFNYKRYCAFQQIFHQCYLKQTDWSLLKSDDANTFRQAIFTTQRYIVNVLDDNIKGTDESSLAKALLIGYKVDLDKDLVQAYSNVGVVHLIAISGLHLALIYAMLLWVTGKISFIQKSKFIRLFIILFCLWFFSLLTGASASVLRSAVMFTFIATGATFGKKASIYNSLASSAFVLLCYDPFMLWDVGFQLSYCAVLGIVIAQKYVFNWFYFSSKLLNKIWKLAAVSLTAQIFTLPLCLYYFHQFPLLFLLSNVVAIPLSTIALWGCIFLVAISPIHLLALYFGKAVMASIWLLNHAVIFINAIPFSLWDGISITVTETIILYLIISFFLYWLLRKNNIGFKLGIYSTLLLSGLIALNKWNAAKQKKLIVYNVPSHKAIDFIEGNAYHFYGDSDLVEEGLLQNFHLKPERISLMLTKGDTLSLFQQKNFVGFHGKRILMIDSAVDFKPLSKKINVDYIIISKNPKLFMSSLAKVFECGVYIFDASNPLWKIEKWKKDCEELHLRFHSVSEQGAFVTDL